MIGSLLWILHYSVKDRQPGQNIHASGRNLSRLAGMDGNRDRGLRLLILTFARRDYRDRSPCRRPRW
jgi:hypothetical protein